MMASRRMLLLGVAASAASFSATNAFAALKNGWQIVGANKFAHSLQEAMRFLPVALRRMQFPVDIATVLAIVNANPDGMRHGTLQNGQQPLIAMVSGKGEVDFDVPLNFKPLESGLQAPIINTIEWDIGGYTLSLPEICFNWCYRKAAPAPIPALPPMPPMPSGECDCCVEVHYILPANIVSVSYEVFGPYSLEAELAKCHPELNQWDKGCVEHRCFAHGEDFTVKAEEAKRGIKVQDNWRQGGAIDLAPSSTEVERVLYLPHDVVNKFGLVICAYALDPVTRQKVLYKFTAGAWYDPYTRRRRFHMKAFELFIK